MPPTNTTPATAIDITTLPYDITLDVNGLVAPYTVWWKRTPGASDVMLGFFAYSQFAVDYRPQVTFWTNALVSPAQYPDTTNPLILGSDVPGQLPVNVGTDIWIKVEDDGFGTVPGTLIFGARPSPASGLVSGAIFINDDTPPWFATVLSPTDGSVLKQARTTVGEEGAIFDSGQIVLQNDDALAEPARLYTYDSNLNLITFIALVNFEVSTNTNGALLYISERIPATGNVNIKTYNPSLVLQNTFLMTGNRPVCIAVKKDNTIVYFSRGNTGEAIRQIVLGTLVVSDFAVGQANHNLDKQCLQVLSDGTVLAAWRKDVAVADYVIKAYNPAGAEIHSYAFTPPANKTDGPRIAVAQDDPNSFWVWASGGSFQNRHSKFQRIKVSDGSTIASFTVDAFEIGVGNDAGGNVMPTRFFGNSKSCPFLILRVSNDASGIYQMVPGKTHDTLYAGDSATVDVKIPNPLFQLYLQSDGG